jgi:hypothetical protein
MQRMEQPLLAERGVQVTTARFIVGGTTYPISGIVAVSPFSEPPNWVSIVIWGLFGLLTIWFGVGVVPLGYALWILIKGGQYGVAIQTASGNVRALVSKDAAFAQRVAMALNNALAMR